MNVLKNVVGLFSSPAKSTPAEIAPTKPSSAKKRNYKDVLTIQSAEKRRRSSYDPSNYQRAVYGTGEITTVSDEDDGEEKHERKNKEEEERDQAHEQLLQEQLRHVRPTATSKSVRRHTHAVLSAPYPEPGGVRSIALDAARTSNDTLDKTGRLLATKPDSEIKRKKLATIAQARAKNNAIFGKGSGGRIHAGTKRGNHKNQAPITRTASANTGLTCVEYEDESESESAQVSTTQQELNKDVESDLEDY
ncbi:unnamed protein product [Alternaria alternata]